MRLHIEFICCSYTRYILFLYITFYFKDCPKEASCWCLVVQEVRKGHCRWSVGPKVSTPKPTHHLVIFFFKSNHCSTNAAATVRSAIRRLRELADI